MRYFIKHWSCEISRKLYRHMYNAAPHERNDIMVDDQQSRVSRRKFLGSGSAVLVAAAGLQVAQGQEKKVPRSADHHLPNETEPGPNNTVLDKQNPDSVWAPTTDAGGQPPFKYSFSLSHQRLEDGGWTRQVTVRDMPISNKIAGVEIQAIKGGIRELHWHL